MIAIMEELHAKLPDFFFTFFPSGSLRERYAKLLPSTSILASDYDVMLVPDAISVGKLFYCFRCYYASHLYEPKQNQKELIPNISKDTVSKKLFLENFVSKNYAVSENLFLILKNSKRLYL